MVSCYSRGSKRKCGCDHLSHTQLLYYYIRVEINKKYMYTLCEVCNIGMIIELKKNRRDLIFFVFNNIVKKINYSDCNNTRDRRYRRLRRKENRFSVKNNRFIL